MKLSANQIADILGLPSPSRQRDIRHLLTDSRSLESPSDSMFFAIPTAGNDGHRYISELYRKGVRLFVVNEVPHDAHDMPEADFFKVPDSVAALQAIAAARPGFSGHMLAITGSRGKTTLKEWIFQLMEPLSDITRSPRSFNSQIGVPLSLWELEDSTRLAVIEAGISRPGEMKALADCIRPDTVIFTNIGEAHSDGFASDDDKAEEKALLAAGASTKCVIFRKEYDTIARALAKVAPCPKPLTWSLADPSASLFIEATPIEGGMELQYTYEGKTSKLEAPLVNEPDLENAANALAFMLLSGIDRDTIAERFRHLHKIGTRLNVSEGVNGCTLIHGNRTIYNR